MADICSDPVLHAEVRAVAPLLTQAAAPCGEAAVRLALQPLALVFGLPEGARNPAFWEVYFKALADLPMEAITKAVEEYPAEPDATFFPKPGPLKALAMRYAQPIRQAAYRAKRAADSLPRKPVERLSPEETAKIVAELEAQLVKPKPVVELPATHGKPDEGGLTEAMRARLANRDGAA